MKGVRTPTSLTVTVRFITLHVQIMTATLHVQTGLRALPHALPRGGGGEEHLESVVMVV